MAARRAAAIALRIMGMALRICAVLLCLLTALLCFGGLSVQLGLTGFVIDLARALPQAIAGYGVAATPFGGVFRLDFALVALALFALDHACALAARALR